MKIKYAENYQFITIIPTISIMNTKKEYGFSIAFLCFYITFYREKK